MRLSFNYTDRDADRQTDRSSELLNIYSDTIKKKQRVKLKTYFVLKYLINV